MSNNLADPKQVERAKHREEALRKQQLNDIRTVMANASGKRLMWRLLEKCGTFSSVFASDSSRMTYLAGKQDLGHFLMAEIMQADENLFIKLMKENKKGELNEH